jgi:hypothetical protein
MNTDTLQQTFRELEAESRPLDPDRVLIGAKRRRRRRTALTGAASLAVAAVTVASFALAGAIGPGADAPVAGAPGATRTEPPLIPDARWYRLSATHQVRTDGTSWQIGGLPGVLGQTGVAGRLRPGPLARGWDAPLAGGVRESWIASSMLKGDVRRVVIRIDGEDGSFRHEAKVYRLGSVPGWVLAYAEYPPPGPVDAQGAVRKLLVGLDAYDATGRRVLHCDPSAPAKPACTTG